MTLRSREFTEAEQNTLQSHRKRKDALEETKKRLLQELEGVENGIIEAQREYGELWNSKSLLKALPNEILATVFLLNQQGNRINEMAQAPIAEVVISQVCSHWRRLALSMPSLWNVFRYEGEACPRVPLDRLEAYLERSQEYPLDLWFDFTHVGEGWPEQLDMLHLVLPHFHRCRRFHVLSDPDSPIETLYYDLQDISAPMLEVFALCPDKFFTHVFPTTLSEWVPTVFRSGAPAMKYARLDATCVRGIRPPLDTLVHLRLEQRRVSTQHKFRQSVLDTILSLPLLESLSVTENIFLLKAEEYISRDMPVEAKLLKHFRCAGGPGGESIAMYFLSYASAPLLESFTIRRVIIQGSLSLPESRSSYFFPSLHTFTLLDTEIDEDELQGQNHRILSEMMKRTRTIKRFVLSPVYQFSQFVSRLLEQEGTWQDLEEVTLNYYLMDVAIGGGLTRTWPKVKVLKLPSAIADTIDAVWDVPGMDSMDPKIESIGPTDPLGPLYWPPGFDWMDNEEDPFHIRQHVR